MVLPRQLQRKKDEEPGDHVGPRADPALVEEQHEPCRECDGTARWRPGPARRRRVAEKPQHPPQHDDGKPDNDRGEAQGGPLGVPVETDLPGSRRALALGKAVRSSWYRVSPKKYSAIPATPPSTPKNSPMESMMVAAALKGILSLA